MFNFYLFVSLFILKNSFFGTKIKIVTFKRIFLRNFQCLKKLIHKGLNNYAQQCFHALNCLMIGQLSNIDVQENQCWSIFSCFVWTRLEKCVRPMLHRIYQHDVTLECSTSLGPTYFVILGRFSMIDCLSWPDLQLLYGLFT